MDLLKLRNWLKANHKSRQWLAAHCRVSKHTVDGWFAGRPITPAALPSLEKLLNGVPEFAKKLSLKQWMVLQKAAESRGISVEQLWDEAYDETIARIEVLDRKPR